MSDFLPAFKVVTTHGVRGEMKAQPQCDGAAFLARIKRVYTSARGAGETALLGVRAQGSMLLVRLSGVDSMDAARAQVGRIYYFAKQDVKLPKGRYFIDDLLGCAVTDADTSTVYGTVADIDRPAAHDVYTVRREDGSTALFPAVPEFLDRVELETRTVYVRPIPGMFDQPLNGDEE